MSRLWISGYRSYELSVFQDNDPKVTVIKKAITQSLSQRIEQGVDWLITGPQLGVEQWCTECGSELKSQYPELKIAVMLPFAEFGSQWNENNRTKLQELISKADFSDQVSDSPYKSPMQLKNYQQFMLSHTDEALFIYDPEYPGKMQYDLEAAKSFADAHPYPISLIDFDELQEIATEIEEDKQE
ncbi:DUF1273 domain-containing protein [Paucilactobacillus suebicus]|uniref:UPF0398 protein FD16_GL000695 n=1 Tax=Paucilactobacillus suebicus DSM 5007 = KCTC 3549 TaxID=1423807 RepID=A0A0R1W7H0_9LACO|nr:DUF1273 domain-containing protein [Paucilactobacillus suebicus]KRM11577.1 hypothetical protein FD16_GL000695 [Paucilactobacillus suebicus DSM 5007 = KCTC 3549]